MDGIDVAMIRTDGEEKVERCGGAFYPYAPDFRKELQQSLIIALSLLFLIACGQEEAVEPAAETPVGSAPPWDLTTVPLRPRNIPPLT